MNKPTSDDKKPEPADRCLSRLVMLPSDRDWTKDFAHENGSYQNRCVTCKETFIGHKRRVVCKKCHDEAEAWFASLTPEQQAIETANKEAAIREWFALHNAEVRHGGKDADLD